MPLLDDGGSAARDDGDELHALADDELTGDFSDVVAGERAVAMMAQLRPLIDGLRARAERDGGTIYSEVSYAFDPKTETARLLGTGLSREDREALLVGDEYPGTADLVLVFFDSKEAPTEVEVYDHKTTFVGGEPRDATEQLLAYAAMAASAHGAPAALATPIVIHEEDARFGVPISLDAIALDEEAATLAKELYAFDAEAQPVSGPWCSERFCKARAACPATERAMEIVLPPERLVRPYRPGQGCASEEEVRKVRTARKLLEAAVSAMKADETAYVFKHGDVVLDDGSVYYRQHKHTEKPDLSVPGAIDALRANGAGGAIKSSATWKEIKKLAGKDGEAAIRERLRAIGAMKTSDYDVATTKPGRSARASKSLVETFDEMARAELAAADAIGKNGDGR